MSGRFGDFHELYRFNLRDGRKTLLAAVNKDLDEKHTRVDWMKLSPDRKWLAIDTREIISGPREGCRLINIYTGKIVTLPVLKYKGTWLDWRAAWARTGNKLFCVSGLNPNISDEHSEFHDFQVKFAESAQINTASNLLLSIPKRDVSGSFENVFPIGQTSRGSFLARLTVFQNSSVYHAREHLLLINVKAGGHLTLINMRHVLYPTESRVHDVALNPQRDVIVHVVETALKGGSMEAIHRASLILTDIYGEKQRVLFSVDRPANYDLSPLIESVQWSPDGQKLGFIHQSVFHVIRP